MEDVDRRAARAAERQFGVLTLDQALGAGLTPDAVRHRVRTGRWGRLSPGVYRVAGAPRSWRGDTYAAVVAAPPGAVASHVSAAALFGLRPPPPLPNVTVSRSASARSRAGRVHRAVLCPADRTSLGVIPVTTPARTLVDCAVVLSPADLRNAVDAAGSAGLLRWDAVQAAMARASARPGRRGLPALRAAIEAWAPGIRHDSPAEVRLHRLLREWGLPEPVTLHAVRDGRGGVVCELDMAWPSWLVGLEYDSPAHHGQGRWARDEERRAGAAALGWTIATADKTDLRPGGHDRLRTTLERLLRPRLVRRAG